MRWCRCRRQYVRATRSNRGIAEFHVQGTMLKAGRYGGHPDKSAATGIASGIMVSLQKWRNRESLVSQVEPADRSNPICVFYTTSQFLLPLLQEQGRMQSLQDELRNEGLAAAKAHFTNIFRREVVVRGLLDNGGTIAFMCSVFQVDLQASRMMCAYLLASRHYTVQDYQKEN